MRFSVRVCLCAFVVLAIGTPAIAKDVDSVTYQQGTILKVARQKIASPNACCDDPTDRPLQTSYYAFEVTVRAGCTTYEGQYETALDFYPAAFTPGKTVQVRATKHDLYFEIPIGNGGRVPIVRRANDRTGPCSMTAAKR